MNNGSYDRFKISHADRIMSAIQIDDASGCWNWIRGLNTHGYGQIKIWDKDKKKRRFIGAPRISYETFVGPIPEDMQVLHTCDNRRCVNPKHLWLGTQAQNMSDMKAKGRGRGRCSPPLLSAAEEKK